jgi:hypothetical protein
MYRSEYWLLKKRKLFLDGFTQIKMEAALMPLIIAVAGYIISIPKGSENILELDITEEI